MDKINRRALYVFVAWLALIFITSCFVIPFDTFVHFVQRLSGNDAFNQWFARFWLVSWFCIVKGWHATEYAILVCFCVAALRTLTTWDRSKMIGVAFAFAVLFAASDEWHQTFVPGRDGCVRDVLIDTGGAAVAAIVLLLRGGRRSS